MVGKDFWSNKQICFWGTASYLYNTVLTKNPVVNECEWSNKKHEYLRLARRAKSYL